MRRAASKLSTLYQAIRKKYKKLANEDNERKLEKLRNNDISSEKPFEGKLRVKKAPDMF